MRYYLIDEIAVNDMERLTGFLKGNVAISGLDKVFWVPIPEDYLNERQCSHTDCRPYYFAIELSTGLLKAEFFIRTLKGFNCTCSSLADDTQMRFIIRFVDEMIKGLKIRT
jgi:hypothetical protein